MARYDVCVSPGGVGFVVDVQTNLLDGLTTRVVAPLRPAASAPTPAKLLNPVVEIDGETHVMVTQFISAVPVRALGKPTGELAERADEITRAVDMLSQGSEDARRCPVPQADVDGCHRGRRPVPRTEAATPLPASGPSFAAKGRISMLTARLVTGRNPGVRSR